MEKIIRKYGSSTDLHFIIDLSEYPSKTFADINDVFFIVKEKQSDADADSLLFKKQSLTNITTTQQADPNLIDALVTWLGNEYSNFTVGNTYLGGIFIKWNGESMADENIEGDGVYQIFIKEDFVHEN